MFLFRFMSMVVAAIALAILVVSNLNAAYPLVFLTFRTMPIPLGWLALGAFGTGIIASLLLRLLRTGARPSKIQPEKAAADFSFANDPASERPRPHRAPAEPDYEPETEFYPPDRPVGNRASVYEANYRVIKPPQNTPQPKVDSNLKPDSEDWGFDFDEND